MQFELDALHLNDSSFHFGDCEMFISTFQSAAMFKRTFQPHFSGENLPVDTQKDKNSLTKDSFESGWKNFSKLDWNNYFKEIKTEADWEKHHEFIVKNNPGYVSKTPSHTHIESSPAIKKAIRTERKRLKRLQKEKLKLERRKLGVTYFLLRAKKDREQNIETQSSTTPLSVNISSASVINGNPADSSSQTLGIVRDTNTNKLNNEQPYTPPPSRVNSADDFLNKNKNNSFSQSPNLYTTNNITYSPPASPSTMFSEEKNEEKNSTGLSKKPTSELENPNIWTGANYGHKVIPTPEKFPSNQSFTRNQNQKTQNNQKNITNSVDTTSENPFMSKNYQSQPFNAKQVQKEIQNLRYWDGAGYVAGVKPNILEQTKVLTRAQRKQLEQKK